MAETFSSASGPDKTAAICYAVGWTQHSKGVQIIRSAAILQLLLGNIGRPGGGILALRGHASIQGSTDIPTLYDILPGYLPMPFFAADSHRFKDYLKAGLAAPSASFSRPTLPCSVSLVRWASPCIPSRVMPPCCASLGI